MLQPHSNTLKTTTTTTKKKQKQKKKQQTNNNNKKNKKKKKHCLISVRENRKTIPKFLSGKKLFKNVTLQIKKFKSVR